MNLERINYILNNDSKHDIFYNHRLVWIQGISNNNMVKVGFVDNFEEKDVFIDELSE